MADVHRLAFFDSPDNAFTNEWTLAFGYAIGITGVSHLQAVLCGGLIDRSNQGDSRNLRRPDTPRNVKECLWPCAVDDPL